MPAGVKRLLAAVDRWQRGNRLVGPTYGVIKKFGDDTANLLVVGMAWYGFTAIYPLLLVVITIFGFVGQKSLGTGVVTTLHEFPVIGTQFNTSAGGSQLHGSVFGLVIGLAGLLYGAQGVTQTCQQAMATAWNIPSSARPGFVPRLGRSLAGLTTIGLAFLVTAFGSSLASVSGRSWALRLPIILVLLVVNIGLYLASFRVLTPGEVPTRSLRPGAVLGGGAFTALTTLGTSLIEHQLKHSTATYGALASVIGVVTYLLLLAKISMYSAELNPVLARQLWPRALPTAEKTPADERAAAEIARRDGVDPPAPVPAAVAPAPLAAGSPAPAPVAASLTAWLPAPPGDETAHPPAG
jgi:uncharacterized BrkB/YihY/UPF0761 family membrane protein